MLSLTTTPSTKITNNLKKVDTVENPWKQWKMYIEKVHVKFD